MILSRDQSNRWTLSDHGRRLSYPTYRAAQADFERRYRTVQH